MKWLSIAPLLAVGFFPPGRSRGNCPVCVTGGSLPCGRYLLAPLTGHNEGSIWLMVPRGLHRFGPRLALLSSYKPHILVFLTRRVTPMGVLLLSRNFSKYFFSTHFLKALMVKIVLRWKLEITPGPCLVLHANPIIDLNLPNLVALLPWCSILLR